MAAPCVRCQEDPAGAVIQVRLQLLPDVVCAAICSSDARRAAGPPRRRRQAVALASQDRLGAVRRPRLPAEQPGCRLAPAPHVGDGRDRQQARQPGPPGSAGAAGAAYLHTRPPAQERRETAGPPGHLLAAGRRAPAYLAGALTGGHPGEAGAAREAAI